MELFPERDGNRHSADGNPNFLQFVRMELFPERDGTACVTVVMFTLFVAGPIECIS